MTTAYQGIDKGKSVRGEPGGHLETNGLEAKKEPGSEL
jgi:hypothetical protein